MEKYLLVQYEQPDESEAREVLFEGDYRQTNERILKLGLQELFAEELQVEDAGECYETMTGQKVKVSGMQLLDGEELADAKRSAMTYVINETVTDPASGSNYSGRTPDPE